MTVSSEAYLLPFWRYTCFICIHLSSGIVARELPCVHSGMLLAASEWPGLHGTRAAMVRWRQKPSFIKWLINHQRSGALLMLLTGRITHEPVNPAAHPWGWELCYRCISLSVSRIPLASLICDFLSWTWMFKLRLLVTSKLVTSICVWPFFSQSPLTLVLTKSWVLFCVFSAASWHTADFFLAGLGHVAGMCSIGIRGVRIQILECPVLCGQKSDGKLPCPVFMTLSQQRCCSKSRWKFARSILNTPTCEQL